jgi:saccharopine dehydrogenase-like NADP-dependent oxidoreductase
MFEKTLRYPGHAALMRVLRESGFFSRAPVTVGAQRIRPLDLTVRLLEEQWALDPPGDLTVMQVVLRGTRAGQRCQYTYDLVDRYDHATHTTSMARTTGYTCAIVARLIASGLYGQTGICPPEYVGRSKECYRYLLAGYCERGITLSEQVTELP